MILGCRVFWEKKEKVSEGPGIDYTSFPPTHKEAQNTSAKTPSAPVPPPSPSPLPATPTAPPWETPPPAPSPEQDV